MARKRSPISKNWDTVVRISQHMLNVEESLKQLEPVAGKFRGNVQDALADLMWANISMERVKNFLSKCKGKVED